MLDMHFEGNTPSFLKLRSIHTEAQQFFKGNLKFEFKYIPRGGGGIYYGLSYAIDIPKILVYYFKSRTIDC